MRTNRAGRRKVRALLLTACYTLMLAIPAIAAASPGGSAAAAVGQITTVAGGAGGSGLGTALAQQPAAVAVSGSYVYIADTSYNVIRRLDTATGQETVVAGDGRLGSSGDGGPATSAALSDPTGVAVDAAGNLYIADSGNSAVRVVAARNETLFGQSMTAGDIYTVAGDGTAGYSGDGGAAVSAQLNGPQGVAVDPSGDILIADTGNNVIRMVFATTGDIYTVAGNGTAGYSGDGGVATSAELNHPTGVAENAAGNALYIADSGNNAVRVVAASGGNNDISTAGGTGTAGYSGDGGAGPVEFNDPTGVAVDAAGNVYIADQGNDRVRFGAGQNETLFGQSMTAGDLYTVAGDGSASGDGGPATSAALNDPTGVAVDAAGNLYIADSSHNAVRVVAGRNETLFGQSMTAGDIYTVAGDGTQGYSGDGGPATSAELNDPYGVAVDATGNLYIADANNNVVRVVAATTETLFGQSMTAGDIYTVAGQAGFFGGYSGDGGPATSAELNGPTGVAVDAAGNLYIADQSNDRIRVVAANNETLFGQLMTPGAIYTVAGDGTQGYSGDGGAAKSAELNLPTGVAVDAAGNLYIADQGNDRIRVVAGKGETRFGQSMTAGDIYTVAGDGTRGYSGDGGPATSAALANPTGVAVDAAGNLYIADSFNNRIRVVAGRDEALSGQSLTAGDIYTVAGDGYSGGALGSGGYSGDGGPATAAELDIPYGVAVDAAENLYIADSLNDRVRMVPGGTSVTGAAFSPSLLTGGATSTWTVAFTTSGSGALTVGQAVYLAGPSGTRFPTAAGDYMVDGTVASTVYQTGGANTIAVLTPVAVGGSTPVGVVVSGVTNPPANTYAPGDFTVSTTVDGVPVSPSGGITFSGVTSAAGVGFSPSPLTGGATSTWTVAFTTSGSGALTVGQAVYLAGPSGTRFPTAAGDYMVDGTVASTVYQTGGANTIEVLTPVAVGGSTPVGVVVSGVTNPPASTYAAGDFTVSTTADGVPVSPSGGITFPAVTSVSGVSFSPSPLTGGATSTWTADFTTSGSGALTVGEAVYLAGPSGTSFPPAAGDYTVDGTAATTVHQPGGANTIEVLTPVAVGDSARVRVVAYDVSNPPVNTYAGSDFTVSTTADGVSAGPNSGLTFTPALSVTTTSLPPGAAGTAYSQTLAATGGTPPYTWSVSTGSLPAGLGLTAAGAVYGTPSAAGTSNFAVTVTDSESPATTATQFLSLTVNLATLSIATASLPAGAVGTPYSSQVLAATGGTPPYTWSISAGSLPAGLSLNAYTGVIYGTPTATGTSNFTVEATDSESPAATATRALSLTVDLAPTAMPITNCGTEYGASGHSVTDPAPGTVAYAVYTGGTWTFACGGTGPFTIGMTATLEVAAGRSVVLEGGGQAVTLKGGNTANLFAVSGTLTLDGLTLQNGCPDTIGGAIINSGTLTISDATVDGNGPTGCLTPVDNGGVYNSGTLTISHSTFSNEASGNNGGAVYNSGGGRLTISHSTFTGNIATVGGAIDDTNGPMAVSDTTFTNNYADTEGAAITVGQNYKNDAGQGFFSGPNPWPATIVDSAFNGNHAGSSGGAIRFDGTLTVDGSTFSNDRSDLDGGGAISAADESGTLTVNNSTFNGDAATGGGDGGAIDVQTSLVTATVTVANSTFSGDTASTPSDYYGGQGGAISTGAFTTTTVFHSTFAGNQSVGNGGAIWDNGALAVAGSTFSDNASGGSGGAIRYSLLNTGEVTVEDSTFSGNTSAGNPGVVSGGVLSQRNSSGSGGAISSPSVTPVVVNSTFNQNHAHGPGGAIYVDPSRGGTLLATNSTFSGNSTDGDGANLYGGATLNNTIVANPGGGGNCAFGAYTGTNDLEYGDQTCGSTVSGWVYGNPDLGPLADNGGPTPTMALLPGSAALGAGDPTYCAGSPVNGFDQRGVARGTTQATCDIGAYQATPPSAGDLAATYVVRPSPDIAPAGSLSPGQTVAVTVSTETNGLTAAPYVPVYLSLTGGVGTASVDGTALGATRQVFISDGNGSVPVQYTAGTAPTGGGTDTLTVADSVYSPVALQATATYQYPGQGGGPSPSSGEAAASTVTASPTSVPANGTSTSTITVTLSDQGSPVRGAPVTLSAAAGTHSTISPASAATNAEGVATFTVSDATPESVFYVAKDATDGVTLDQTALVVFTAPQTQVQSTGVYTITTPGTSQHPVAGGGAASATPDTTFQAVGFTGTVGVVQYSGTTNPDPAVAPPPTNAPVYFDVSLGNLNATSPTASLTVTECGVAITSRSVLYWLNGSAWSPVTNPAPSFSTVGGQGCLAVTLTANTAPSLQDLTGTLFAVAAPVAAVGGGGGGGLPVPSVSGISPSSGPAGATVTVSGSGFTYATAVDFGGAAAESFTVASDTRLTAVAPAGTGTVDVTVTSAAGTSRTSSGDQFTYAQPTAQRQPAVAFSDVPPSYWAYQAITTLAGRGIVNGFPDGTFRPDQAVTRAEFVKMLALAIGLKPVSGQTTFADVPTTSWFAPYVAAAVEAGIVDGTSARTFSPDTTLTREQMAVMLARALKLSGTVTLRFSDDTEIDSWALQGVEAAVAGGYLKGFPDGSLQPLAAATRAQAAEVLAAVLAAPQG